MMSIDYIQKIAAKQARLAKRKGKQPMVAPATWGSMGFQERLDWVRTIPNIGSYQPKGWAEADRLFVDKSGWGSEGESALTVAQFVNSVTAGKAYAIVEEGQFQIYIGVFTEA